MTRRLRDRQNSWAKQPLKMYDDPFPSRLQLHLPGVHDDDDDGTVLETLVGISPIAWIIRFAPEYTSIDAFQYCDSPFYLPPFIVRVIYYFSQAHSSLTLKSLIFRRFFAANNLAMSLS